MDRGFINAVQSWSRGSALPSVLVFSFCMLITLSIYLRNQTLSHRASVGQILSLRSQANSRSALWYSLDIAYRAFWPVRDNQRNAMCAALGNDLFGGDSSLYANLRQGAPIVISIPELSEHYACEVSAKVKGSLLALHGLTSGVSNNRAHTLLLGGGIFKSCDTLLYLTQTPSDSLELPGVLGRVAVIDSKDSAQPFTGSLVGDDHDTTAITFFMNSFRGLVPQAGLAEKVLLVRRSSELGSLMNRGIPGALVINGAGSAINLEASGYVATGGDLQISGTVTLRGGMVLVAGGDVKINGAFRASDITIFAKGRIFFGDEFTTSSIQFSGTAISESEIEICSGTRIEYPSVVVSYGMGEPLGTQSPDRSRLSESFGIESKPRHPDAQSSKLRFGIYVRDGTSVDAILVAASLKGIKVWPDVNVKGIVWSKSTFCHLGNLEGIAVAQTIVSDESSSMKNMDGRIRCLKTIRQYNLPFFLGRPTIISWSDNMDESHDQPAY